MATHYVVHHLDRVASTQDVARARYEGTPCLVTATAQDAGRGRGGAEWLNATRTLAASLAVEPAWPDERLPLVTLVAGMAARAVLGSGLRLKWPNDVVNQSGDKIAGLLSERTDQLVVVGLGVNLYWPTTPVGMAALYDGDPGPDAGPQAAERWAGAFLDRLAAGPAAWDPVAYEAICATLGTDVTWDGGGPARAVGVDGDGGLIVEGPTGRTVLRSGLVRQVRPTTLPD